MRKGLQAAGRQLGNEGFLAKAPAAVVEGLKKQQAETQSLYDKARAALESSAGLEQFKRRRTMPSQLRHVSQA